MFLMWVLALMLGVCDCAITYDLDIYGESQNGYYVILSLGTPPQKVNFILDTGSSNIAVATVPIALNSSKYFHYNESETLDQLEIAVDLHYVLGRWNGFLARDVISFSNATIECTIACMVSIYQIFDDNSPFRGLLGLAYQSKAIPDSSVQSFIDVLVKDQNIKNIFCLDICGPYFTSKTQATTCGKFHIGHISESNDDIIYTPVIKEWYYEVLLTNFKVGKIPAPLKCWELNKDKSIIDSGTTDLVLPKVAYDWAVEEVKNFVKNSVPESLWINKTVACMPPGLLNISDFPSLTLTLYQSMNSTFDLIVHPELYLLPIGDQSSNNTCFKLAFAMYDEGVIIGSSILKGFYVVFDRINGRIGFANSSHLTESRNYPGIVSKPNFSSEHGLWCKRNFNSSQSAISPLMIFILFTAVLVTIVLLYMLVSWIFRHFIMRSGESSETSSLVDGILLETWK